MKGLSMRDAPRLAVVTGAAAGIGHAISRRLSQQGHRVMMVDRSDAVHAAALAIDREPGTGSSHGWVADVSCEDGVRALMARIIAEHGELGILVNNAGISRGPKGFDIEQTALADWDAVLGVNLTGAFLMCREAVPSMRRNGWGRIVNIASRAGRTAVAAGGLQYAASKAGMIGMTRTLALQCGRDRITVNCVAPGRVETAMTSGASPAAAQAALKGIPLGRAAQPDEVAGVVAFLCSSDGAYITGAVIDANGGSFMG